MHSSSSSDGFDIAPEWVSTEEKTAKATTASVGEQQEKKPKIRKPAGAKPAEYYPLSDTLRLYAGWLLAWYFVIYAFGAYQFTRALPLQVPILEDLFYSPVVLHFAAVAFIYLLLSSVHRLLGKSILLGMVLCVAGAAMYWGFRMYA